MDKSRFISVADTLRVLKTIDIVNDAKSELPDNCVVIGNGLIVIVCFDDFKVNIHVCEFIKNVSGELLPTENEIVLSPFLWQSLCDSMNDTDFVDLPTSFESFSMVKNELFLAVVEKNYKMCITMQRCFMKPDFSRYFFPGILMMSEYQWSLLKDKHRDITEIVVHFMLKHELKDRVLEEVGKRLMDCIDANVEKTEAEMTLNVSLCELLKIHLVKAINVVFKCDGCRLGYANQLGHECVILSDSEKLEKYFNVALTLFNMEQIAYEFVQENNGLLTHITEEFFNSLNVHYITDFVRKLY